MDPLNISASIIAILQLSASVIGFINDVKGYDDDRTRIPAEIASTQGFLYILKDKAERAPCEEFWGTMRSLNLPNGPLEQFKLALERLESKLQPDKGLKKIRKALTWPLQKGEVQDILSTIERQKSIFLLAITNNHMYVRCPRC